MVKILNCYLYAKKSYSTLSKGANFYGQPCIFVDETCVQVFCTSNQILLLIFGHFLKFYF